MDPETLFGSALGLTPPWQGIAGLPVTTSCPQHNSPGAPHLYIAVILEGQNLLALFLNLGV